MAEESKVEYRVQGRLVVHPIVHKIVVNSFRGEMRSSKQHNRKQARCPTMRAEPDEPAGPTGGRNYSGQAEQRIMGRSRQSV